MSEPTLIAATFPAAAAPVCAPARGDVAAAAAPAESHILFFLFSEITEVLNIL